MAQVSISEAARLAKVSRPTIYKMINSGKLSFTSVIKNGKQTKVIDTSEIFRVFGTGTPDNTCKSDVVINKNDFTPVNSDHLHDLQHKIELLTQENVSLKDAVSSREEHIASLKQAMLLIESKLPATPEPVTQPVVKKSWQFWKK